MKDNERQKRKDDSNKRKKGRRHGTKEKERKSWECMEENKEINDAHLLK